MSQHISAPARLSPGVYFSLFFLSLVLIRLSFGSGGVVIAPRFTPFRVVVFFAPHFTRAEGYGILLFLYHVAVFCDFVSPLERCVICGCFF